MRAGAAPDGPAVAVAAAAEPPAALLTAAMPCSARAYTTLEITETVEE